MIFCQYFIFALFISILQCKKNKKQNKTNNNTKTIIKKKFLNPFTAVDAIWCSEFRQWFSVLKKFIIQYNIPISCYVALT